MVSLSITMVNHLLCLSTLSSSLRKFYRQLSDCNFVASWWALMLIPLVGCSELLGLFNLSPVVASFLVNPDFRDDVVAIQRETEVGFKQSAILSQHESEIINYTPLYQPQPRKTIQLSPGFHDYRRTLA
ncbi:MAG: hypothetical protein RI580_07005, partial [Halothece sp. Uz-M2-17]|nr:hypothetical protein [Halothece sp. Uz-M2-17]